MQTVLLGQKSGDDKVRPRFESSLYHECLLGDLGPVILFLGLTYLHRGVVEDKTEERQMM